MTKKLIILGAGASAELDYPTGRKLLDDFNSAKKIFIDISRKTNYNSTKDYCNQIIESIEKISSFSTQSIDKIISDIKDRLSQRILKWIMVLIIRSYEKKEHSKGNVFYKYIMDALKKDNNCEIITFNYDVSVENYIYNYCKKILEVDLEKNGTEIRNYFNKIIHVYGNVLLGEDLDVNFYTTSNSTPSTAEICNWWNYYSVMTSDLDKKTSSKLYNICNKLKSDELIYGDSEYEDSISYIEEKLLKKNQDLIESVKTIAYERVGDGNGSEYDKYKEKVKNADIIYIMGFGFDKFNCENVLGFDEIKQNRDKREELQNKLHQYHITSNGYKQTLDEINKIKQTKIFYTNYNNIPVINRMVKYYFGDGENVVKSKLGCSETMAQEFNFDSEI